MIRGFAALFVVFATLGLPGGLAKAADLPARSAAPVYTSLPLFTWTGFYAGGQIGYGWGRANFGLPAVPTFAGSSPDGIVGGAHAGYNYQINQFVLGLEGDIDGTGISRSVVDPTTATVFGARIPVEGSIRGRAGVAWDRAFLYATGGAAFADVQTSYTGGITPFSSTSSGRVGWTLGGGVEYAVTNAWSVRGEYRYSDFGHQTIAIAPVAVPVDTHVTEHAVRVGFSYKFEMYAPPPPVVGKY
jgi:outer membrane immunogenic protein